MTGRITRRSLLKGMGLLAASAGVAGFTPGLRPSSGTVAADAPALQLARIAPGISGRQAAALGTLDDTHRVFADGSVEMLLWPGDRDRLDALGVRYEILDPDLFAPGRVGTGRVGTQPGERDDYRRLPDYWDDLNLLVEEHPGRARLIELPHASLTGRPVYGIEIGTDLARRDGRPVFFMDGLHHAREWPAGEMPIMFAFDLLDNYGTDPRITAIVDGTRTIIVPVVNPDGFNHSREALVQTDSRHTGLPMLALGVTGLQSYWRKNRRSFTGVTVAERNPDAYGIDLNRNYAFLWGGQGSSGDEFSQTYRGDAPYSEPEPRNVRDLLLANPPQTMITHHTSGQIMLYPWGRDPNEVRSPDADLMQAIGDAMAAFNGYVPKQAYGLYPTAGTSRDWGHAATGTVVYTFEHSTEFHGPYADVIPEMYAVNREAFLLLAERAADPSLHARVAGRAVDVAGNPVPAEVRVRKDFDTPRDDGGDPTPETLETAFDAAEDGTFDVVVNPSTRPFLVEPRFEGPGTTEPWQVVIAAAGREPVSVPVTVARGEAADLGDIRV